MLPGVVVEAVVGNCAGGLAPTHQRRGDDAVRLVGVVVEAVVTDGEVFSISATSAESRACQLGCG
jgi:hypothetical protein